MVILLLFPDLESEGLTLATIKLNANLYNIQITILYNIEFMEDYLPVFWIFNKVKTRYTELTEIFIFKITIPTSIRLSRLLNKVMIYEL